MDAILLIGKCERSKGGGIKFGIGGSGKVKVSGSNFKTNVTEMEGSGIRFGGGVFAWTEEKEEGEDDHVGSGNGTDRGSSQGCEKNVPEDR